MITHNFTCSDFDATGGSVSCTGSTITFSGAGSYISDDNGTFTMANGTWYFNATYSGTGPYRMLCGPTGSPACNTPSQHVFNSTQSDYSYTVDAGGAGTLYIRNDPAGGPFIGDISSICITDTLGGCDEAPVATSTSFDSSTTTEAYLGSLAVGQGILIVLLFLMVVGFMYNNLTSKKPWL